MEHKGTLNQNTQQQDNSNKDNHSIQENQNNLGVIIQEELETDSQNKKIDVEIQGNGQIKQDSNQQNSENNNNDNNDNKQSERVRFADEVKINDEVVLEIPLEKYFYDEDLEKPKRQSRWGDKQTRIKKKIHQDVVFNPLEALGQTQILSLTADPNAKNNIELPEQKKRQSKFGHEYEKVFDPPFLHYVPNKLSLNEIEYAMRLYRLDEINKKLQTQAYLDPVDPDLRSPSPAPIYDNKGQRTNTRENRAKEYLQREKADILEQCMKLKKTFVPPHDYKPLKKSKKIFIPESDWDNTNYIGLIIGPQGKTQKTLEKQCGCKISIRGKGANVKQSARYGQDGADENLHILLQADTDDKIEKGAELIDKILKQDLAEEPQQDAKNMQIVQLQTITGMFIDFCENCHEKGHRAWQCPHQQKIKVKCDFCGEYSHPSTDCPLKAEMEAKKNTKSLNSDQKDFAKLLLELEGDNAKKLLDLAGKSADNEQVEEKQSNVSFITDFNKNLLALTYGPTPTQQVKKSNTIMSLASNFNELQEEIFKENQLQNNMKIDDTTIAQQQSQFLSNPSVLVSQNSNLSLTDSNKIVPPSTSSSQQFMNQTLFQNSGLLNQYPQNQQQQQQQQQQKSNNPLLNPMFLSQPKVPPSNPITGLGLGIGNFSGNNQFLGNPFMQPQMNNAFMQQQPAPFQMFNQNPGAYMQPNQLLVNQNQQFQQGLNINQFQNQQQQQQQQQYQLPLNINNQRQYQ